VSVFLLAGTGVIRTAPPHPRNPSNHLDLEVVAREPVDADGGPVRETKRRSPERIAAE
jgi:hypothetical protein